MNARPFFFIIAISFLTIFTGTTGKAESENKFVDLSLLVAEGFPATWPEGFPRFKLLHISEIGRSSAYNIDTLILDGNTGTQIDVPPHSVARPELKLPHSGPFGTEFTDKTPAWKFVGEACIVDIHGLLGKAPNGVSPLIQPQVVQDWESKHRPFRFGDVVLMHSGYSDMTYRPLPEGRKFIAAAVEKKQPGWPDPHPDTMEYLAGKRGVRHIGVDSPSMGPLPDLAEPTHYAALKHGAIFTEGATNLAELPKTGAFYCAMGPRHKDGPYGEGRAFAIVGPLAKTLIASARKKQVVDLSVVNSIDHPVTWPGQGVDNHRQRYTKIDFMWSDNLQLYHHGHSMDSQAGTSLVPPAYALPPAALDKNAYAPEQRIWLEEYEEQYGPRGVSGVTTEQVPLSQTCGWARVVDVTHLVGSTNRGQWPTSPEITVADLQKHEATHGKLQAGEVVIFHSGHTDRTYRERLEGNACFIDPLAGKAEGWPSPGPAAILYLAKRGIQCVGTDGPTLGGVDEKRALMTYWALGSNQMVAVECLTNVASMKEKSYFIFSPTKIQGCHGGLGRAIALY